MGIFSFFKREQTKKTGRGEKPSCLSLANTAIFKHKQLNKKPVIDGSLLLAKPVVHRFNQGVSLPFNESAPIKPRPVSLCKGKEMRCFGRDVLVLGDIDCNKIEDDEDKIINRITEQIKSGMRVEDYLVTRLLPKINMIYAHSEQSLVRMINALSLSGEWRAALASALDIMADLFTDGVGLYINKEGKKLRIEQVVTANQQTGDGVDIGHPITQYARHMSIARTLSSSAPQPNVTYPVSVLNSAHLVVYKRPHAADVNTSREKYTKLVKENELAFTRDHPDRFWEDVSSSSSNDGGLVSSSSSSADLCIGIVLDLPEVAPEDVGDANMATQAVLKHDTCKQRITIV